SRMIFVGGSTGTDTDNVHDTVTAIQEALELCSWNTSQNSNYNSDDWKVPVVLFPAAATAFSPSADAITFMMLMNSTSPKFLIEEQVKGARAVKQSGVIPLSMGYVVCAPGGKVGEVGQVSLVKEGEVDRVAAYAMCAEAFGFSIFYLETGSKAESPVSEELIRTVRQSCSLTLIVGGGIRDGLSAQKAIKAGADWVVTGNLTEVFDEANELQSTL
ncbi:MAG: geranylgeranylglyceryl/heptaprenylglyceryl phosphate synthase, partial [Euryarchaeota archaeon]|nr:geranylgeranylglyceryl/heptaprenylglyceryl phosphate synthase [Euryarchaeota archaeon]